MNKGKKTKWLFLASLVSLCIMSSTILFMPLASDISNSTNKISLSVVGSAFWICLVTGIILSFVLSRLRKSYYKKLNTTNNVKKNLIKDICGRNLISRIAFIIGVASLIVFTILLVSCIYYSYFLIVLLFLQVFSLCVYTLFNGKNFIYIRQIREEKQNHEQI